MRIPPSAWALCLAVTGCAAPANERRGEQSPIDRARPPEVRMDFRSDGPTAPRTSPQRPPEPEAEGADDDGEALPRPQGD